MHRRPVLIGLSAVAGLALSLTPLTAHSQVTLTFDTVDATAGNVDATAYLAEYGVTESAVTAGTSLYIADYKNIYGGAAETPSSLPNLFTQGPGAGPMSYTLHFSTPQISIGFTRIMLIAGSSGVTHPEWSATAYDASGQELNSVGEGLIASFRNVPAARYLLTGPNISSLTVTSNAENFAGSSSLLMDDLTLGSGVAPTATPEPGSCALLVATSIAGGLLTSRRLRRYRG